MMQTTAVDAIQSVSECPSCGDSRVNERGRLPQADCFAGRFLDAPLPGGRLLECQRCGLHFRWPRMSKDKADALYAEGYDQNWNSPADKRPDWQLAKQWIQQLDPAPSVLDIACFDGRFLDTLDGSCERYGIEIHEQAAERAKSRGVNILASDFDDLRAMDRKFRVITAFDILEHVHQPRQFVSSITESLEPGGVAIIGTGNTDSKAWQFMGTNYWYCSNLEHVSFINPRWCEVTAEDLGLELANLSVLSHCYPTISKICRETTLNVLHRASPHYSSLVRYHYRTLFKPHKPNSRVSQPVWFSAKDHLLAAFRRPQ